MLIQAAAATVAPEDPVAEDVLEIGARYTREAGTRGGRRSGTSLSSGRCY
jgi:hypothetical protein